MRRLLLILMVVSFAFGDIAPGLVMAQSFNAPLEAPQQAPHRRTLLEMLFGPRDNSPDQQQQLQQQVTPPKRKAQPVAQLPPAKPIVAKADGATRIAIFGDSLAVDVGKAIDRFYADDPNVSVLDQEVGSSGFVRTDFFDWNKAIAQQIKDDSFDVAVMIIGINERQTMNVDGNSYKPLTDEWNKAYSARLNTFLAQLRAANKPVVWIGLPPMAPPQFSSAMSQISALQRLASFGNGAEFVDIYDKFLDDNGNYVDSGPDVNGQQAVMRKSDGIHFASAGADKVAFYASQAIKLFAHGAGAGLAVADPLAGTDAAQMLRPPYQGLGQIRLLQVAGAVMPLTGSQPRADDLINAASADVSPGFDLKQLLNAPVGRADAFGAGVDPEANAPVGEGK